MQAETQMFSFTLNSLMAHIAVLDETGEIVIVNRAWREFAATNGLNPNKVSEGINYLKICDSSTGDGADSAALTAAAIRKILAGEEESFTIEYPCHSPTEKRWFIARITRFSISNAVHVVVHHENITAQKIMEISVRESEEKFRDIFERSVVAKSLTKLTGELDVNQAFCDLLGYTRDELLQANWNEVTHPDDIDISQKMISSILKREQPFQRFIKRYIHKNGSIVWTDVSTTLRRNEFGKPLHFMTTVVDITPFKHLEAELVNSKRFLENVLNTSPSAIFTVDLNQIITSWNLTAERITGYKAEEVIGQNCSIIYSTNCKDGCRLFDDQYTKPGEFRECELITKDGKQIFTLKNYDLLYNNQGEVIGGIESFMDISRRKLTEQKLQLHSAALEAAANGIIITDKNGFIEWVNPAWCEMTGYSSEEAQGENPRFLKSGYQSQEFYQRLWNTILSGQVWNGELINKRKDGSFYSESETITPFKSANGEITHFVAIKQDITQRKQTEQQIDLQLGKLAALREIDRSINETFNLKQTLNLILTLSLDRLNVNAATILLFNPEKDSLTYSAGIGFRTCAIEKANVKLDSSFIMKASNRAGIAQLPDESLDPENNFLHNYLKEEEFVSYFGAPLKVKGELIGLMELFHRSHQERDEDWLDFFSTLSGQAAIAIDNAQLFEKLTYKNKELVEAYDATIEGWSYALDLRDKETEGHSKRVTSLVLKMAKKLGLDNDSLVQIHRGAVLHDIGKMGVPDYILHKPEKLTDDEFDIIKLHPGFSYQMLKPIAFLQTALDIPYSHHENWDGSGYPQGLKGEDIPFTARMFAIIDVYDALTSDRPYRKAWSKQSALEYIQQQSGIKFDPHLIPLFMEMINGED